MGLLKIAKTWNIFVSATRGHLTQYEISFEVMQLLCFLCGFMLFCKETYLP
jgi:hypothetical protein